MILLGTEGKLTGQEFLRSTLLLFYQVGATFSFLQSVDSAFLL